MTTTIKTCSLVFLLLVFCIGCGEDSPYQPEDGADTLALFPLREGSSWLYSVDYKRIVVEHSNILESLEYSGTYSMHVLAVDSIQNSYVLEGRYVLDSITVIPITDSLPDTTIIWNIVTLRDSLWFESGDSLIYFMPDNISNYNIMRFNLNLEFMRFPWWNSFPTMYFNLNGPFENLPLDRYSLNVSQYYGSEKGTIIPEQGGLTYYRAFYSPFFISWHTEEYLTIELQKYIPGTP